MSFCADHSRSAFAVGLGRWARLILLLTLAAPVAAARGQGPAAPSGQNAASPAVWITRQRAFSFPVNVPPAQALGGEPAVVELFFSADRGASWQKYDSRNLRPTSRAQAAPASPASAAMAPFVVHTERDGEYYFASRILDALNRPLYEPAQLPEQRVIVDTLPPRLEFTAVAGPSGEVQGQWQVFDEHLKPDTLTLEYQPAAAQPWLPLAFDRPAPNSTQINLTGSATWFPQTGEQVVTLRATVYDWAGNSTVVTRRVALGGAEGGEPTTESGEQRAESRSEHFASGSPPSPAPQLLTRVEPSSTAPRPASRGAESGVAANPQTNGAAPGPVPAVSGLAAGAAAGGPPSPASSSLGVAPIPWPNEESSSSQAPSLASEYPYRRPETFTTSQTTVAPETAESGAHRTEIRSDEALSDAPSPALRAPPSSASPPHEAPRPLFPSPAPMFDPRVLPPGERPRMTNVRKFSLEYDVSAVGPQGVAKVELWITRDGGQSWQAWATDPDRQSPMEVSLPEEGVYGFRVVVTGRNGLAGQIPTAGEMADVWIGIDLTAPTARLTAARYGLGKQAGQLDIRWEADDVMLAARPVTLLFSETPHGPWTIIATGLPNTGSYNWQVDPRTPKFIYLRIEVRDEAGNVGADQLREPITLEGLQPKARVRSIQPLEGVGFQPRPSVLFR